MVYSGEDAKSVTTLYEELVLLSASADQGTEENDFVPHFISSDSIQRVSNSSNSQTKCPTGRKEEEETKEEHPLDQQPTLPSLDQDITTTGANPSPPEPKGYIQFDSNGTPYSVGFCGDPNFEGGPLNPEAVILNGAPDMGQFLVLEVKDSNSDYIQPMEF